MKLILLRHGQSVWNKENRFTGWTDVPLSELGIIEAKNAGKKLKEENIKIDIVFLSVLKRAIDTFSNLKSEYEIDAPVYKDYRLNERHYGALQGLNKEETALKYGKEQVHLWRRSADVRPPLLSEDDPRNPAFDTMYKDVNKDKLPLGECLNDTVVRVKECYEERLLPLLKENKNILISAHGNSLRALVKLLENVSDEDIVNIEIPTGKLIIYDIDENLQIISKKVL